MPLQVDRPADLAAFVGAALPPSEVFALTQLLHSTREENCPALCKRQRPAPTAARIAGRFSACPNGYSAESPPLSLQDLADIDRFGRGVTHVERLFDVVQVLSHQVSGALLVAGSERIEQGLVLGLRAGARTARSVEADDQRSACH